MADYYNLTVQDAVKEQESRITGLTDVEVDRRLSDYGLNELKKEEGTNVIRLFLQQFTDFLMILLLIATAISLGLKEWLNAIAIMSIVILSAILGFIQEFNAEKAIQALKKISAPTANVIRDGRQKKIPASSLVPGDIILIDTGDIIPADARVLESSSLKIDESSLTGESVAVEKNTDKLSSNKRVADQKNMVFMSSIATYGKGKALVTYTGMNTELGKIAESLKKTEAQKTPLQIKFAQMAKQIGYGVIVLVAIVFLVSLFRSKVPIAELFIFALSLAVAAVPSSLPAIVTIGLSMGTKTLAKKKMIIKRLPAAESLGAVTVICSDKTGTLTKNQMTVTKLFFGQKIIDVSGSGYDPTGDFSVDKKRYDPKTLELLAKVGVMCNNASLIKEEKDWKIMGDPTEASLLVLGKKAGLDTKKPAPLYEIPFDSERKMMSVIYKTGSKADSYVKGAPDLLLARCSNIYENGKVRKLTPADRKHILKINTRFAESALRVLAFAYKSLPIKKQYSKEEAEKGLIFVGLVGMIDPPRTEVKDAVEKTKAAGIEVIVITGDHALTAKAVAQKIGLFKEGDEILTGDELEKMSDQELAKVIKNVRIIARALPIQKSRIVDALKKNGHIVAMTGDGVNDAPALKKADIGISMGISGTDVAKEVSKAILVDDNFASIVNAIGEGRNIYDKIIKSTRYLLSCNAGEIITVFFAIMLRFPLPLLPLQILLMNLVTDGLPALGLGVEPSDDDVMTRPPRDPKEKPITDRMIALIVIFGITMGIGTLYLFNIYRSSDLQTAQTVAFTTLVLFEMFAVLGSRSFRPFKKLNPFTNIWLFLAVLSSLLIQAAVIYWPPMQSVFGTVPLTLIQWLEIIGVSSIGFFLMEASKQFLNMKRA